MNLPDTDSLSELMRGDARITQRVEQADEVGITVGPKIGSRYPGGRCGKRSAAGVDSDMRKVERESAVLCRRARYLVPKLCLGTQQGKLCFPS
jgi:hypothetical protein